MKKGVSTIPQRKVISARVDDELKAEMDLLQARTGKNITTLMTEALQIYFAEHRHGCPV